MFKNVMKEQLKVPAHIDYLPDLRDFVTRIGKKHGFSDRVINAFKLSIDEASTNIIRHAYRETGGDGFITIRGIIKKDSLTICLIDQGKYFDPKHVKDPDLQRYVDIGKKGGLGIFIMRRLMDEIDYRKTEEGNELRLTKNRDASPRRRRLAIPIPKAVKAIPLSLKAKYWLRTTLILTAIIGIVYLYRFFDIKRQETAQFFVEFIAGSNLVSNSLQTDPRILEDITGLTACHTIAKLNENELVRKAINEIILVDSIGFVVGHLDQSKLFSKFELPPKRKEIRPGIFAYTTPVPQANGRLVNKEVYHYVIHIRNEELHLRSLKGSLDQRISTRRWADARIAGLMFVLSTVGSFLLIYILMNPFRKLAEWVRLADHGEIEDEMDIDTSTEIGEIAQAFSEITAKFRASQKNLAEQERLQKEMQVAQEIQQTLLPSEFPEVEGYELASYYEAAREVGGDYYDFVEVDKDTLGIAVADVSGKGVPGSLVMTMIRTALRTEARGIKDAAEVLARVNDFVMPDMKKGMFVTIFYVIIDSKRRRLNYASAGHNPMILYRASTKKTYYLNPRGFPIGIQLHEKDLFKKSIESDTIQMAEDDILLIYTDGITEAMNAKRELFGEERLLKTFREYGSLRVNPFVDKIKEEILSFTEGTPQSDDITLVAIREKTSPEKEELRRAKEAHKQIVAGMSIREACESVGITTYAYYNKYKKEFEEKGTENVEIEADVSVEAKHIAIEDKVKIYDIIKNHPEYGAKRINEELNTEKYGFTLISESKIYDELVRSRLNTRQLREAFVARGGRSRRPMKQPGTPMLTLDGKIILDRGRVTEPARRETAEEPTRRIISTREKRPAQPPESEELPVAIAPRSAPVPMLTEPLPVVAFARSQADTAPLKEAAKDEIDERTPRIVTEQSGETTTPAEAAPELGAELFSPPSVPENFEVPDLEVKLGDQELPPSSPAAKAELDLTAGDLDEVPSSGTLDISFEDLFAGGTLLDDYPLSSVVTTPAVAPLAESAPPPSELPPAEEEAAFFALDDVIRQEFESNFSSSTTEVLPEEKDTAELEIVDKAASPQESTAKMERQTAPEPLEMDLPFVEVSEILEQASADSVSYLIEEPTPAARSAVTIPTEDDSLPSLQTPSSFLGSEILSTATKDREAKGDGRERTTARVPSPVPAAAPPKNAAPPPEAGGVPPALSNADRTTTTIRPASAPAFAGSSPERRRDGRNGSGPSSRRDDDRERLLIAGLRHYKNQRYKEAIAEFEKAIQLYPDFKEAYSILGNAYFRNRMYDEAATAYARVKEMDPYDTTAYENMGVICANRGDYMQAMKEWQRVLEIDPGRDDIRKKIEKASRMLTRKTAV